MGSNRLSIWRILPIAAILSAVTIFLILLPGSFPIQPGLEGETSGISDPKHAVQASDASDVVKDEIFQSVSSLPATLRPHSHTARPAQTVGLTWNITREDARPDGVLKTTYRTNGQFPGPVIEARSGDRLEITVNNFLDDEEGVAIHWHGLRVANAMDGAVGVTQCAIPPNGSFTYILDIANDQAGTFWYHSHSDTQRADGLFGPLIIHRPASGQSDIADSIQYNYTSEQVLMVGDWYHQPASEVLSWYLDWKNFKMEPVPDSLLLNGEGYFDCSKALRMRPVDCQLTTMPHLSLPLTRTRLRIVNVGALTGFSLQSTGFKMTVIEVDGGNPIDPYASDFIGTLYPGERLDIIVEPTDATNASRWLTVHLDREAMRFPNLALTSTQQFPILPYPEIHLLPRPSALGLSQNIPEVPRIQLQDLNSSQALPSIPEFATSIIPLYATIAYLTEFEYRPKGFINHTSWLPAPQNASTPQPFLSLPRTAWAHSPVAPTIPPNTWIDLVITNLDDVGHPFHLHGPSFAVVTVHYPSRPGAHASYNLAASSPPLNTITPRVKDTVFIPSMGYAVLRLRANTPGLWLLHCHVLWHQAVGMNALLSVTEATGREVSDANAATLCETTELP